MAEPARLYTPKTLAERWGCSEAHIKGMARRGYLATFRLGGKLLRISADEVERWERGATAELGSGEGECVERPSFGELAQGSK